MKFTLEGKLYEITFRYTDDTFTGWVDTSCEFREIFKMFKGQSPESVLVAEGVASCAPEDQFCKETGRKIALTRCIDVFLPYDDEDMHLVQKRRRRVLWEVYFDRRSLAEYHEVLDLDIFDTGAI